MNGPSFDRTDTHRASWTELPDALSKLWDACMQDQKGSDVARALTANFVGIARAPHASCLIDATEQLQRRSPCRAFLLVIDEDSPSEIAELTATTRKHGPLRDIVLEQIVLRLHSADLHRMPGLLRPLILDDLPSHLLWALPWPTDGANFETLAEMCQHAIVDSRSFGDPERELQLLRQRRERGEQISDLSWLRVQPWRRALAEAFERFEWRPGTEVRGTIRHGREARTTAMLLRDWLHQRLAASITLEPAGDDALLGPAHVSLHVGDIEVVVDQQDGNLVTHVTTPTVCLLPFTNTAFRATDAELLVMAMDKH
ncbi:MAG: glucose-6-phosphate dehydrogenase assembly protein OpcA [Planctomycetota bacterium]